jgi:hypothetical protein
VAALFTVRAQSLVMAWHDSCDAGRALLILRCWPETDRGKDNEA